VAAIGASLRRANRCTARGAEGVDIAAASARIMHVLYVGAQGTAVALEDYAKDLRSRLRVDTKGAGVSNCERLLPQDRGG